MCFAWLQNKQRLFPYTTLADWFCITEVESVYCAVRTEFLYKTYASCLKRVKSHNVTFKDNNRAEAPEALSFRDVSQLLWSFSHIELRLPTYLGLTGFPTKFIDANYCCSIPTHAHIYMLYFFSWVITRASEFYIPTFRNTLSVPSS